MKFTIHNLRMIKARFSSNGWVLAELFLVFIVMWFLCDGMHEIYFLPSAGL